MKILLIAGLGLLAAPNSGLAAAGIPFIAAVQANHSVSLTRDHKAVRRVRAGTYTIRVYDRSKHDSFHLELENGNVRGKQTGTSWTGTVTWRVALTRGTYRYFSNGHRSGAKTFKVV
jgi:hypothetical protein